MNKEELIKEYDEKAKALRDEFISKLENKPPYPKFRFTYPREDETLYFIDLDGEVFLFDDEIDDLYKCFEYGNLFSNKEEARVVAKERKLLFKLHQWAKEKNDGWEPNWNDDEDKYYIYRNCDDKELRVSYVTLSDNFTRLPYFKSREIAQECIDLFGDEIKEVLV